MEYPSGLLTSMDDANPGLTEGFQSFRNKYWDRPIDEPLAPIAEVPISGTRSASRSHRMRRRSRSLNNTLDGRANREHPRSRSPRDRLWNDDKDINAETDGLQERRHWQDARGRDQGTVKNNLASGWPEKDEDPVDARLSGLRPLSALDGSLDLYCQYRTSVVKIVTSVPTQEIVNELSGTPDAQPVADFLSKVSLLIILFSRARVALTEQNQVLDDPDLKLSQRQEKTIVHLLSKLAKSARVFPKSLVLEGVQCNFSQPFAEGGYGYIYQGLYEGRVICVKSARVQSVPTAELDNRLKVFLH